MATLKRREKPSKKSKRISGVQESPESNKQRKDFEENTERLEERTNGSSNEQASYMSLDVLAQVAADTLRDDAKLQSKATPKKISKRSIQCLDILNLEQIQALSDKALLNFFSEMTCNEMTRNFTYQCYLMPDRCQEKFTSFGNETKAKLHMRQHLIDHIEQLIGEANDPERKYQFIFTAEPIHVRNRKLSVKETEKAKKKRSACGNSSPLNGNNAGRIKSNGKTFTNLKASKEINRENKVPAQKKNMTDIDRNLITSKNCLPRRDMKISDGAVKTVASPKKIMTQRYPHKQAKLKKTSKKRIIQKKNPRCTINKEKFEFVDTEIRKNDTDSEENSLHGRIEENELFIIDLLSRTQPHHDHCYTTIFGKKRDIETQHLNLDSDGGTDSNDSVDVGESPTSDDVPVFPILELNSCNEDTPLVAFEEIVDCQNLNDDGDSLGHCGQKPYPPMPKSALAKKGKIHVPEESESFSEGEADEETPCIKKKKKDCEKDTTAEWERRMALRCIRELKTRKKDDKIALVCQICLDKTFTASATLMYHYRSHAGIKPFVCLLCNTTFTRQHSLNYHMLIHNNQSRFTCKDCGRKFRHPSHFKEHLRRHTGETPFECKDCPQKFKTRNTYKRHLKTRHGKLLTATGIHVLSKEEFMKVRTKPYKKYNAVKDNESGVEQVVPELIESQLVSPQMKSISNPVPVTSSNNSTAATNTITSTPATTVTSNDKSLYVPIGIFLNTWGK